MGRKFGREMCGVLPFRSDKTGTLHPTMSAVPLPDATLTRLIRPTSSRSSLPPEVLILIGYKCKKACSLSRLFEFGR